MFYRYAESNDISTLTTLLNRSYRGESSHAGWTTEADLLGGRRIDEAGLLQLFHDPDSLIFIARSDETIFATIHARREADTVHFGLFAVEPTLQTKGIGKALLAYAESEAHTRWGIQTAVMEVISHRRELIAYYERRGYRRTGETIPFPESDLWEKKVEQLALIVMRKNLASL